MANLRRVERWDRYVSLNLIDDYQGRIVNIEERFDTLPHCFCIPLQWMNESIFKETWKHFMQLHGIEYLNDSMVRFIR